MTDTSVSLYYSFSRNGRQHCELGAWVKVESGETQKWFGRVRYMIFVFCFWIDFDAMSSSYRGHFRCDNMYTTTDENVSFVFLSLSL